MFFRRKFKALKRQVEENEELLFELKEEVKRLREERKEQPKEPKPAEVTPRQIINEWFYTEEELKSHAQRE